MLAEPVRFPWSLPLFDRTSRFVLHAEQPFMDLTTVDHVDQSTLSTRAIYELRGDALTYCVAPVGKDRPTEMKTQTGDERTLVTLKRIRAPRGS
jgi:hypothetical protein